MSPRLSALAFAAVLAGCHPSEQFESVGQIVHSEVIEVDDKGKPLIHEIEFEWDPCPGDQFQVVRGGAEFAECVKQYGLGDMVAVHVMRFWCHRHSSPRSGKFPLGAAPPRAPIVLDRRRFRSHSDGEPRSSRADSARAAGPCAGCGAA